jgi:hypothetical protein
MKRFARCVLFVAGWLAADVCAAQIIKLEKLSDEQLVRLQKVALAQGSSIAVPPPLVGVLHFTPAQIAPALRQVSFQLEDGVKHGFAHLNDDTGYFLFRRSPDGLSAYHVDKDFHLVDAAHNFGSDRFVALPAKEAQDEINGEVLAWSQVLAPKTVPVPPPLLPAAPPAGGAAPAK